MPARNGRSHGALRPRNGLAPFSHGFVTVCRRGRFWKSRVVSNVVRAIRFAMYKPGADQLARATVDRLLFVVHAKRPGCAKVNTHNSKSEIHARSRAYPSTVASTIAAVIVKTRHRLRRTRSPGTLQKVAMGIRTDL